MTIADENTECGIGHFKELVFNEGWIDWRYWLGQMPRLDAAQAARLMNGLDPEIFASLDNPPNSNDSRAACDNARRMQRLAEACGMSSATPRAWLEWADGLEWEGFKAHELFRVEVGRQEEYVSAWKNLDHIADIDREIQTWETTSASDIQQLDRKEQKIAGLREKRAALHGSVFPSDSQQQATEPQAAFVVTDSASGGVEPLPASQPKRNAATGPVFSMARTALVSKHEHNWPTINRDLKDAAANALWRAKAGARDWNEAAALAWAEGRGKLRSDAIPADALTQAMNSMGSLPGRKHKL